MDPTRQKAKSGEAEKTKWRDELNKYEEKWLPWIGYTRKKEESLYPVVERNGYSNKKNK